MARMNGTETIVASATSTSDSIRTTIPVFVAKQLDLRKGDHLDWRLDKNGKTWIVIVTKQ